MQLGHEIEVHTVHTGNQSRWQEYHIHHREDLDDLVLLDVNKTEESILQVVETIETKTRVFEQRIDILDNHRQTRLQLRREEIALEEVANHTLFIHDVLTDNGDFFLKILDLDQYLFVHLVGSVDLTRKLGDEIGSILDHIRVFFDTRLHERYQHMVARWEIAGVHEHLLDRLVEAGQFHIAGGDKNTVLEDEVDRLHLEIVAEEVGVGHDGIVGLDVTRRHLDLFHLFVVLNVDLEEVLENALSLVANVEQVDPDDIFLIKAAEDVDAAAYLDLVLFVCVFIEYLEF